VRALLVLFPIAALATCVNEPSTEELAAQHVVITKVDPGIDFAAYQTFATTDSIDVVVEGAASDGGQDTRPVDPAIATATIESVAAELSARGYRRVTRAERPDLGVALTGVVRLEAFVTYGAWWGYGSATPGYWGAGGNTFATGISSPGIALWKNGALVIELYDLRATPVVVLWAALIYGAMALDKKVEKAPVDDIEQAFVQSSYLRVTQ
jgi:hypothetical protein